MMTDKWTQAMSHNLAAQMQEHIMNETVKTLMKEVDKQPPLRRISASRLNSIEQCSMKFYLNEILGLPEKTWARTHAGSAAHGILECLARDKHRLHHDIIKSAQTIYASPAVSRLVRAWQWKTKMPNDIVADIDAMCLVAINHSNFLDVGAIRRFDPEHEFTMTLGNGAVIRGFIDRLAQFSDRWVISDFKTAREKHSKKEVASSYQSLCYQLYIWKTFGALAEVRYYFLRHPPTKMTPQKHVMVTPPATPAQLIGFEAYLEYMYKVVNSFGLAEAHSNYCADEGFCERVCSHRRPYDYWDITKADGAPSRRIWIDPKMGLDISPPELYDGEVATKMRSSGCPKFNPQ